MSIKSFCLFIFTCSCLSLATLQSFKAKQCIEGSLDVCLFDKFLIDKYRENQVYVGARNQVFKLSNELKPLQEVSTGSSSCVDPLSCIYNSVEILEFNYSPSRDNDRLVLCKSKSELFCALYSPDNLANRLTDVINTDRCKNKVNTETVTFANVYPKLDGTLSYDMFIYSSKTISNCVQKVGDSLRLPIYNVQLFEDNSDDLMFNIRPSFWKPKSEFKLHSWAPSINFLKSFTLENFMFVINTYKHKNATYQEPLKTYIAHQCRIFGDNIALNELPITCDNEHEIATDAVLYYNGDEKVENAVIVVSFISRDKKSSAICEYSYSEIMDRFNKMLKSAEKNDANAVQKLDWMVTTSDWGVSQLNCRKIYKYHYFVNLYSCMSKKLF